MPEHEFDEEKAQKVCLCEQYFIYRQMKITDKIWHDRTRID